MKERKMKERCRDITIIIGISLFAIAIANIPNIVSAVLEQHFKVVEPVMGEAYTSVQQTSIAQLLNFQDTLSDLPPDLINRTVKLDFLNKGKSVGNCSGFFFSLDNSYQAKIITADHCNNPAESILITQPQKNQEGCSAILIKESTNIQSAKEKSDITLWETDIYPIKDQCGNLENSEIVPESDIEQITTAYSLSFPEASIKKGNVFAAVINGFARLGNEWCSKVKHYRGSSGGPVVDQQGRLIGVLVRESEDGVCITPAELLFPTVNK